MAIQNLVSASLSAEAVAEVRGHLEAVRKRLAFLTTMDAEELRSIVKAGKGYAPLLDKASQVVADHPEILPRVFPIEEFRKDYQLYRDLAPIQVLLDELGEGVGKTMIALSSDTMVEALEVYAAVKQHANKVPGLAVMEGEMAAFFSRPRRKDAPLEGD